MSMFLSKYGSEIMVLQSDNNLNDSDSVQSPAKPMQIQPKYLENFGALFVIERSVGQDAKARKEAANSKDTCFSTVAKS